MLKLIRMERGLTKSLQEYYIPPISAVVCMFAFVFGLCVVALLANKDEYNFEYFSNATDSRML